MDELIRIEDAEGWGIYRSSQESGIYGIDPWEAREAHPLPHNDSLLSLSASEQGFDLYEDKDLFHYGFKNLETLRRWIYEDDIIRTMHENGFALATYTGQIIHGHTQSIVLSSTRKMLQKESLLSILDMA